MMKGTEKQIAWAEDIKATYMERTSEYTEYLKKVAEAGDLMRDEIPALAMEFVARYHENATYENVDAEMRSSDLYKVFKEAQRGTPEKKAAGKAYRSAVAAEALTRLEKAVAERASVEDATFWIENRMN